MSTALVSSNCAHIISAGVRGVVKNRLCHIVLQLVDGLCELLLPQNQQDEPRKLIRSAGAALAQPSGLKLIDLWPRTVCCGRVRSCYEVV